ncbi:hypothetical protein [Pararhizobium mangrovi]|nr:hypothetical protein [Pararhizobium mangrovi]
MSVGDPIGFEDEAEGRRSRKKLAGFDFDKAVFCHGGAVTSKASERMAR